MGVRYENILLCHTYVFSGRCEIYSRRGYQRRSSEGGMCWRLWESKSSGYSDGNFGSEFLGYSFLREKTIEKCTSVIHTYISQ